MAINDVVQVLPWNENSAWRWNKRKLSQIKNIVIHQSLGTKTAVNTNAYHISKECHVKPGVGLPHIAYHYFIDFPTGEIYQCNALDDITWHVVNKNTSSLGICLGGFFNYSNIKCRDIDPTKPQIESLNYVVDYLLTKFKLTTQNVFGHGELQDKKACPGLGIIQYLNIKRKN